MSRLKQIERRLLLHSAVLLPRGAGDAWGSREGEEIPLRHIRVEGGLSAGYTVSGQAEESGVKLYYDCVNSLPRGLRFQVGDGIRCALDGEERQMTVKGALAACTDAYGPPIHHWELDLE